jgi:heat shock protein HtpX
MAHILNGDMVTLALIQGVINTFVIFLSNIAARAAASFFSRDDEGGSMGFLMYNMIYMLFQALFGFFAMFVVMWFSRTREYRADLGGAQYTSRSSMIA